ncbi:uncharacterized protein BXZ73DRAFT_81080 [Epithele typhae]|uniref:uncharacterized protein n=1 Tax=Epithele typhae TaxID=378194 RepID=UPI0020078C01|nr:uncharacterized protein BXZ73DRAFT_81080 [Epithele typhae]KAH9916396.1 hypothetical protein BXZ73DRAFT_81080 [Epithele typhae]
MVGIPHSWQGGVARDVLANWITALEALRLAPWGRPILRRHRRHAHSESQRPSRCASLRTFARLRLPHPDLARQQSGANTDAFDSVAERATALIDHVRKETLDRNGGMVSTDMERILQELESALNKVQNTVKQELEMGRTNRLRRKHLQGKAQECLQKLEGAWHSFDTAILVQLERRGESLQGLQGESLQGQVESLGRQVESLKGQVESLKGQLNRKL